MREQLAMLVEVFRTWLYLPDLGALYVILATIVANRMAGDPVWSLIVGPPGSGKTELLQSTTGQADIFPTATLTEGALLSGSRKKEWGKDAKGGLLRQIGDFGILLIKDFGSLLTLNKDTRGAILQAMREVYDGSWTRHLGTDGGSTLSWQGKVGLVGGATTAIDAHHSVISTLGERFVYYRIPEIDSSRLASGALAHNGQEYQMRQELVARVNVFFACLDTPTEQPTLSDLQREWLINLAVLVARARSGVERDPRTREVDLVPDPEAPTRLVGALYRLLTGLQVIGLEEAEAYRIIEKVAFDSMPQLRRRALELLTKDHERLETPKIAARLNYPTSSAKRALEDLHAHGVLEREPGHTDMWWVSDWAFERYQRAKQHPNGAINSDKQGVVSEVHEASNSYPLFVDSISELNPDRPPNGNGHKEDLLALRAHVLAVAREKGCPEWRRGQAETLPSGEPAWGLFVDYHGAEDLHAALAFLEVS